MDSVVAISLQGLQLTPVFHKILNSGASGLDTSYESFNNLIPTDGGLTSTSYGRVLPHFCKIFLISFLYDLTTALPRRNGIIIFRIRNY